MALSPTLIRPKDLTPRPTPIASEIVPSDNGDNVGGSTWLAGVNAARPFASQAEAEAGTSATKDMSPLTTAQAIAAIGGASFATTAQGTKADSAVQPARTITAGTGLTGGGDLSADRSVALSAGSQASLALADTAVQPARSISAGTGLTGGGSLAADRTIALSASTQKAVKMPSQAELYQKRVRSKAPFLFADYAAVVAAYSYPYLNPQGWCVDEVAGEAFIIYSPPDGGANKWGWVICLDWETLAYIRCFSIGQDNSQGVGISYESGSRFIWAKTASHAIAYYDITSPPANMSRLTATGSIAADLRFCMSLRDNILTVEQYSFPVGFDSAGCRFYRKDLAGNRLGLLDIGAQSAGATDGYQPYLPKLQSISEGPGFYAGGYGGAWKPSDGAPTPYSHVGVRLFTPEGAVVAESLCDPSLFLEILIDNGVAAVRTENEGVHVLADGTVISLLVTTDRLQPEAATEGITFVEEFAKGDGAIDFTSAAIKPPRFDLARWQGGMIPLEGGKGINPLTGLEFASVAEILDFMRSMGIRFLAYHSSDMNPVDILGNTAPTGVIVKLENANNSNFYMHQVKDGFELHWLIFGSPRQQGKVDRPAFKAHKNGTSQTITAGSNVAITFSTETYDTGGEFASNAYTPKGGLHRMNFEFDISGHADGDQILAYIMRNGVQTDAARTAWQCKGTGPQHISVQLRDTSDGTVVYTCVVFAAGAGSRTIAGNQAYTSFSGELI